MGTPDSTVVGAERWLTELGFRDLQHARFILKSAPDYRDLTPTQYEIALDWLRATGLVDGEGRPTDLVTAPAVQVFRAAIEEDQPAWLPDADILVSGPVDLPIDAIDLAAALDLPDIEAFEAVHAVWRKFDDQLQRELGTAGELAMMEWLANHVDVEIVHVSEYDDTAGYDIELRNDGYVHARVEVKATRRMDSIVIYLSRNEYNMMRRHSTWCLQVVSLDSDNGLRSLGWLRPEDLERWAPYDKSLGLWQTMKLVLPATALLEGAAEPVRAVQARG